MKPKLFIIDNNYYNINKMEESRLNSVYNNLSISDNDVIIRVLNTFLHNEKTDPHVILSNFTQYTDLLENLLTTSAIKRPKIKYIIDEISNYLENSTWNNFVQLINRNTADKDPNMNYEYLYIMCYCRSIFDCFYKDKVLYNEPKYAIEIAYGESPWNVFLKALPSKSFFIVSE